MTHPFSPDARRLLASVRDDRPYGIYTLEGGAFEDIGLSIGDLPIRWSADGRYRLLPVVGRTSASSTGWI